MSAIELYTVTTIVTEFHGCKDVAMSWFFCDRKTPVGPYAELIADYDPADEWRFYPQGAVDEMFTADEAQALLEYLNEHHREGSAHLIGEAKLPIPMNIIGNGAIAVGGPQGFYMLCKEEEWNLPLKVWGYYDLRQHEPAPGCELERNRALRRGTFFVGREGCVRASELTDEQYQRMRSSIRSDRRAIPEP